MAPAAGPRASLLQNPQGAVLYTETALYGGPRSPLGTSLPQPPLLPPFSASPAVLRARPGFFVPAKGLAPAKEYMEDYWQEQAKQTQQRLQSPPSGPPSQERGPYHQWSAPEQGALEPDGSPAPWAPPLSQVQLAADPRMQQLHSIALGAAAAANTRLREDGVWLYGNCRYCTSRGCFSTQCPHSGWRGPPGTPIGAPKQDLEAAREIAAAAAQGNILAAAAAAQFFSPEDAASLKAAALVAPCNRGRGPGPQASDPLAILFKGPPPQRRHERASRREDKHSGRGSGEQRAHRSRRVFREAAAGGQWGPPEGAAGGAPVGAPSGRESRRSHSTGTRRESSCAAARGTSKETAASRDCRSYGEMRYRQRSRHAHRKQQQQQQAQYADLRDPLVRFLEGLESQDLRQILMRLVDCRRLETQIEGDLHQLALLDSLLLQREATDAASAAVSGKEGPPCTQGPLTPAKGAFPAGVAVAPSSGIAAAATGASAASKESKKNPSSRDTLKAS
ncbi:hypothetical protein Esti_003727 [Eimeria stiedai]